MPRAGSDYARRLKEIVKQKAAQNWEATKERHAERVQNLKATGSAAMQKAKGVGSTPVNPLMVSIVWDVLMDWVIAGATAGGSEFVEWALEIGLWIYLIKQGRWSFWYLIELLLPIADILPIYSIRNLMWGSSGSGEAGPQRVEKKVHIDMNNPTHKTFLFLGIGVFILLMAAVGYYTQPLLAIILGVIIITILVALQFGMGKGMLVGGVGFGGLLLFVLLTPQGAGMIADLQEEGIYDGPSFSIMMSRMQDWAASSYDYARNYFFRQYQIATGQRVAFEGKVEDAEPLGVTVNMPNKETFWKEQNVFSVQGRIAGRQLDPAICEGIEGVSCGAEDTIKVSCITHYAEQGKINDAPTQTIRFPQLERRSFPFSCDLTPAIEEKVKGDDLRQRRLLTTAEYDFVTAGIQRLDFVSESVYEQEGEESFSDYTPTYTPGPVAIGFFTEAAAPVQNPFVVYPESTGFPGLLNLHIVVRNKGVKEGTGRVERLNQVTLSLPEGMHVDKDSCWPFMSCTDGKCTATWNAGLEQWGALTPGAERRFRCTFRIDDRVLDVDGQAEDAFIAVAQYEYSVVEETLIDFESVNVRGIKELNSCTEVCDRGVGCNCVNPSCATGFIKKGFNCKGERPDEESATN